MPNPSFKPFFWLKFTRSTSVYELFFTVQIDSPDTLQAPIVTDDLVGRKRTVHYNINDMPGGAGTVEISGSYRNDPLDPVHPFDPTAIDYIILEIQHPNDANKKGKSTTCTTEADASGGGDDLDDRYERMRRP